MICKLVSIVERTSGEEDKIETFAPTGDLQLWFWCPGCDEAHAPRVKRGQNTPEGPCWGWNDSLTAPTLTPSILVHGNFTCHSFLTDGVMNFLSDCTHAFAGQRVPLPELPKWLADE